jgi:tRNA-specific 2-thiouridylase
MIDKKVLLGLSGGVDSAIAALILQIRGYEVHAIFMRCFSEEKNKITGECPWIDDLKEAKKISIKLNIPLKIVDYEKEYTNQIIKPMFQSYAKGKTPNPDIDCNTIIKFPFLIEEAKKMKINYIATGHYVKKIEKNKRFYLKVPKDKSKDQTYFLYGISQKILQKTLFPIGDYTKSEVRKIAEKNGLTNWNRKSTRGLCFIGNIDIKEFLKQKLKNKSGKIFSPEKGVIGIHQGNQFFTIGERLGENKNIRINNEYRNKVKSKLYVAEKNSKNNTITIAPENHPILYKNKFQIKKLNWISDKPKLPMKNIEVRIRHLGELIPATIEKKSNKIIVTLKKLIQGIAEGQSAVIYTKQGIMLGGGEIAY